MHDDFLCVYVHVWKSFVYFMFGKVLFCQKYGHGKVSNFSQNIYPRNIYSFDSKTGPGPWQGLEIRLGPRRGHCLEPKLKPRPGTRPGSRPGPRPGPRPGSRPGSRFCRAWHS